MCLSTRYSLDLELNMPLTTTILVKILDSLSDDCGIASVRLRAVVNGLTAV